MCRARRHPHTEHPNTKHPNNRAKSMSDENDPKPMKKTSAVPLRKETVRVTLKATPQGKNAPAAPGRPPAPTAPTGSKPPAPAPTIPLKTSGPGTTKPPATAPTIMQTGASVAKPAAPAPTVRLNVPGATGPATVALTGGSAGVSSQPLPKATVQLQQTQPMGAAAAPSQAATIRTADDEDTTGKEDGVATALSVVALIVALIVLGVQLGTASIWVHDAPQNPGWGQLFE